MKEIKLEIMKRSEQIKSLIKKVPIENGTSKRPAIKAWSNFTNVPGWGDFSKGGGPGWNNFSKTK